jgi:hypothetical protein
MKARLVLFLALLTLCTGAALAQTPDGETPAEETVCDSQTGAAYGLCNAYCEAMDCDSEDPAASETACTKVRTKFQNITGNDMPCEAVSCPCAGHPFWEEVLAGVVFECPPQEGGGIARDTSTGFAYASSSGCGALSESGIINLPATPGQGAVCIALLAADCPPAG